MLFQNLVFVVTTFLLLSSSVEAGDKVRCRENERRALMEFKANAVDDFGILYSWDKSKEADCCSWRFIRCSNLTGHVILLNLPASYYNNSTSSSVELSGKVSPSLSELKHLKYLNLDKNQFDGEIPHQLGSLTNLRYLDLGSNFLNGEIPYQFGNLKNLRYLDLGGNSFDGKIPHQLGNLIKLRYLDLGSNSFDGEIPLQLGNLTSLSSIDLSWNQDLVVENLDWVSHLHLLTDLDLSVLNLSRCNGWLNQIIRLPSLTQLDLNSCDLPNFDPSIALNNVSFSASKTLAVVDMSGNYFISTQSYSRLFNFTTSLVSLDLSSTSLSIIPEAIGKMIFLESLILHSCGLGGMIPDSFRNLSRLTVLDLGWNNLNGLLSEFLLPLATKENSLQDLDLTVNQLGGPVPDNIARFTSLRSMSIYANNLSGPLPDTFWQLSSSLVNLNLADNRITGPLPNLTLFSSLETLNLENNKLEGTVPGSYFSNLSKLSTLGLSYNSLSFNFSFDWVAPFKLDQILFINCTLGPHFPNWIKSQRNFSRLDLSHAGITDSIPIWFWDLSPELRYLNMSNNQIEGTLPDLSLKFSDIGWIDLSYNRLQGSVPHIPVGLGFLDLSHNLFAGSLSFICTTPYIQLSYLDLSANKLSGELQLPADCLMNISIRTVNLANNDLHGNIPSFMGLGSLQLRNNNFSGQLPLSLMNNTDLQLLDLSKNKLTGAVPAWIGTLLTSLVILSLRMNEFSGSIPLEICHLRSAQVLDFSQNRLTGSIPYCIDNITSLVEEETDNRFGDEIMHDEYGSDGSKYENAVVQWKGVQSEYGSTLKYLKFIDLSSNSLFGKIPQEFASLKGLISLNLSSNNLTGSIIPKIDQMKNLENLDLSKNHLSGEIPLGLASLTLLSVLDLSYNNLKGEIPRSTQLQSFDASKYAGNEHLCGLPLNKCGGVISLPAGRDEKDESNEEEHDDNLPKVWLYTSVVLGFITGFWGLIGPIMLRITWRQSYYKLLGDITDWIYVTTMLHMTKLQKNFFG